MSYAVIRTGGKQYRVAEGDTLQIEKIEGEPDAEVVFDDVVLARKDDEIVTDAAALKDIKVQAKILRHGRGKKIHILKFKRRKGYQRKMGHRQPFTEVKIAGIA